MKKYFSVITVIGCMAFFACNQSDSKKESSNNDKKESKESTVSSGDNLITFKVNGEQFNSSGWNISRFDFGNGNGQGVNVTSNMHQQPKTINVNINGDKPGTYLLQHGLTVIKTPGVAYGSYKPDYMNDMLNSFSFQDGEFTIVSIDTTAGILNATFHGTAKNTKGETVTITDGKVINGKLKLGVTRY